MKYIALVALSQSAEGINLHHKSNASNQQKLYKILEDKDGFSGWHAGLSGFPGTVNENGNYMQPYARAIPTVFSGDAANDTQVPLD